MGVGESRRRRGQPTLRLPLLRVASPPMFVEVAPEDANNEIGACGDRDLRDGLPVCEVDRLGKWKDGVFDGSAWRRISCLSLIDRFIGSDAHSEPR